MAASVSPRRRRASRWPGWRVQAQRIAWCLSWRALASSSVRSFALPTNPSAEGGIKSALSDNLLLYCPFVSGKLTPIGVEPPLDSETLVRRRQHYTGGLGLWKHLPLTMEGVFVSTGNTHARAANGSCFVYA